MKKYNVKQVSQLSGVSVKTLHHYDKMELLKPAFRSESGYRFYCDKELLRLQQILFYKNLGLPLKEIKEILDDPEFDSLKSLENHKIELLKRQEEISSLLDTIDNTINHLKEGKTMSNPEMLYEGMPKEQARQYREEAVEKYGKDTVELSENELTKLGKDKFQALQVEFKEINNALFEMKDKAVDSEEVQSKVAKHYQCIKMFWGTTKLKDKQGEAYAGLGQLYVDDERYCMVEGKPQPEFAAFLKKAMEYFAENVLK